MSRSQNSLTVNRLAAIMLAIPVKEVNGNKREATSPMALSRWDGWSKRKNRKLYSHGTYGGNKRAHWNPGVGLWQLDTFEAAKDLNHAERADTAVGGLVVAKFFRDEFCKDSNDSTLRMSLDKYWYGCSKDDILDQCYDEYEKIYKTGGDCSSGMGNVSSADNDCLNVNVKTGSEKDGGVQDRTCRWSGEVSTFDCFSI